MLQLLSILAILAGADDDLAKALREVRDAGSYQFSIQEGGTDTGVEGKFQKGLPAYFRADRIEFFRQNDILVYRQNDKWQRTRTGTQSDPLLILGASAKVRAARLPHEELARLGKALTNLKKTEAKDQTLFSGELPEAAARELARTEDRDVARGGTAQLWLDGKGRLIRYQITIQLRGRRGNVEVDGKVMKTVTVGELGTTKVEVPAEAKKVLSDKAVPGPSK